MLIVALQCSLAIAMTDRSAKKQRLMSTVHSLRYSLPHMSQSALAATLRELSLRPLEAAGIKRDDIRKARSATAFQATPYGPLISDVKLTLNTGEEKAIAYCHPLAMLSVAAALPTVSKLLRQTLQRKPSTPTTPWRLCIYSDEVVPGNPNVMPCVRKGAEPLLEFLGFRRSRFE